MPGIVSQISLILDQEAKRRAERDAAATGRTIGDNLERGTRSGFDRMMGGLKQIGAAIGAAFAVRSIVNFGQAAIQAAKESETAWNSLGITLRNNKVQLQDVRAEVEALGRRALRQTTFGDEAAIQSLNRLVQITGDYKLALRAVPAAMDLAVAKSIGLDEASKLLGRALTGNTTALKRQGIELDKTKDVIDQLTAKFGGSAEGELLTFGGRVKQLGEWFGELKEAIGEVLIASVSGGSALEVLTAGLQGLTTWVQTNKTELGELASIITKTVTVAIKGLAAAIKELRDLGPNILGNTWRELKSLAGRGAWIQGAQSRPGADPATLSAGAGHGGGRGLQTASIGGRAGSMVGESVDAIVATGQLNQQIIAQGAEAVAEAIKTAGDLTKDVQADILAQWEAENTLRLGHIRFRADAEDQAIQQMMAANVDLNSMLAQWDEEDRERKKAAQVEYLAHLEDQAIRLESIVDNTIAIGQAWGLVTKELGGTLNALSRVATDAAGFAKSLATGDVLGAIGSGVNLIGNLGTAIGIKGSKDPERFATNQAYYERAIQGDESALEFLRTHSVVSQNGSVGWGSGKAAADAAAKYAAARRIVDAAGAPERERVAAEEAERQTAAAATAAEDAERTRLDQIREQEEKAVGERAQRDELASEEELKKRAAPLGDAIVAVVAAAIAESRAADAIAAQSPFGEDSPLARDAARRAEEKVRDAERAVEEAEREKERIAGDKVTPGFTVQRTITETSAGRLIGELATISSHTSWIPKLYDLMAEIRAGDVGSIVSAAVAAGSAPSPAVGRARSRAGAGTSGGGDLHLTSEITLILPDGEVLTRLVSTQMYRDFQDAAMRAGNAGM